MAISLIWRPPVLQGAHAAGKVSWTSFDLVYFDPSAGPKMASPFNVDPASAFTTEMRIDYLRRYGRLLEQRAGVASPKFLAFDAVTPEAARERAANIKEEPKPHVRQVIPLKYWRWKLDPDASLQPPDTRWLAKDFQAETTWNAMQAPRMFAFNRGADLRTHFLGPKTPRVLLSVGSIIDVFEVWVNGRFVRRHSGFEPVTFDLTGFAQPGADNTVALHIENKPQDQIGIADNVEILGVSNTHLSDVFVKTNRAEGHQADVTVELEGTQASQQRGAIAVQLQITPWFPEETQQPLLSQHLSLLHASNGAWKTKVSLHLAEVRLWSPDSPHLYLVRATLQDAEDHVVDDLVEVTGFRRIEQRDGRLYLNGQPWFMKSFGETLGFAPGFDFMGSICPPDEWLVRDLMLAKKANANTIRIHPWGFTGQPGHYTETAWPVWGVPNSSTNYRRIAWIADQLGVGLIWGTRVWTLWPSDFQKKYAGNESWQAQLEASLRHVRNRPSILVYEGLNEVAPMPASVVSIVRRIGLNGAFWERVTKFEDTSAASLAEKSAGELKPLYETLSRDPIYPQYEDFIRRYFNIVNTVDDSRMVIPDTPMLTLFNYAENTFYSDHQYYGWYVNLPQGPLLEKELARPFVLMEAGAEAMPDWSLYAGLPWNGIWLNNGHSSSAIEKERIGRPLRILDDTEVEVSQAYQGLSILDTVFATRFSMADGINVNLIADGLAEGNYHKGVCDLERKAKLGFFAAQMAYQPLITSGTGFKFVLGRGEPLHLRVAADSTFWGKPLRLTLQAIDEFGNVLDTREMTLTLQPHQRITSAGDYVPVLKQKGYYVFRYTLSERQDGN